MPNEVNGVYVDLHDQYTIAPISVASRDRTFIFGTASKGPRHTPITPKDATAEDIFGAVKSDYSFDSSLVRGYYEFANTIPGNPDVALIRVGNVKAARATLYENKHISSGELGWTPDNSLPSMSFYIDALEEGEKYNKGLVTVQSFGANGQAGNGFPTNIKIEIPGDEDGDTISAQYSLSQNPGAPGVISSVSELVNIINANAAFSGKIRAGFTPLVKKGYELLITGLSNSIDRSYNLNPTGIGESWGDKLVSIDKAYVTKYVEQEFTAGKTQVDLSIQPIKSDGGVQSIGKFVRLAKDEEVLEVSPNEMGQTTITVDLFCKTVNGWDDTYSIKEEADPNNAGQFLWKAVVKVKRNGSSVLVPLAEDQYTINSTGSNKGSITIAETKNSVASMLNVGDRYFVSYRYQVSYQEANTRSELIAGSDRSYFIFGSSIIFGAPQPADTIAMYNTNVYFTSKDIEVTDSRNAILKFVNAANLPKLGETVKLDIKYQPELPAVTGSTIATGITQNGAFIGGDDGRMLSKRDYLKAVKEAMKAVSIYPRSQNVIMGLYLDDLEIGYNEETGNPEEKPMNWFTEIFPLIDDVSDNVSECSLGIPVKPPSDLTVDGQNKWIDRLINNSTTDPNRAANIIDSINYYKADAIVGAFKVAIPNVLNGTPYFANPSIVYSAIKSQLKPGESMTNRGIPGSILGLGVTIQSKSIIGQLNSKRYTAAIVSHTGKLVIADAPTLGRKNESQFDRQFVRESIFTAIETARVAAEPYIGKPRRQEYLTAMKKDVLKALSCLSPDILSDFYVEVVAVNDGYITGETMLKMVLTTAKEIRTVRLDTYVKLSQ